MELGWEDTKLMGGVVHGEVALDPAWRVVFRTVGLPWNGLAVANALEASGSESACENDNGRICQRFD